MVEKTKKKGNIKITCSNFKALLSSEHCENLGTKVPQQLRGCVSLLLFLCLSLPASGLRAKPMPLVLQPASKWLGVSAARQKAGCSHTGLCKRRSRDHVPPGRAGSLPCCPRHGLARLPQFPALALAKDAPLPDPCGYGLGQP